jgi:hypothetical protein
MRIASNEVARRYPAGNREISWAQAYQRRMRRFNLEILFSRLDRFVDSNQIYINRVEDFLKSSIPRTTDAFEKFQA